jgi:hypothetical protein
MHRAGAISPPLTEVVNTARQQGQRLWRQLPVRLLALGALGVFVISIAIVSAIELGLGKSLAAAFGVSHSGAHGTSVGSLVNTTHHHHSSPTPSPPATPSSPATNPSPSHTPTPSPTATVTKTSPTPTPSPSSSSPNPVSSLLSSSPKSR